MSELAPLPELVAPLPIDNGYNLAVIKDGIVYEVMNVDGQQAALLLSGPTFIQIPRGAAFTGDSYDSVTGEFTPRPADQPEL
jgi:hypothetical protein